MLLSVASVSLTVDVKADARAVCSVDANDEAVVADTVVVCEPVCCDDAPARHTVCELTATTTMFSVMLLPAVANKQPRKHVHVPDATEVSTRSNVVAPALRK